MTGTTWQDKARRLIDTACRQAYVAANPPGTRKHRPYHVPDIARDLIQCLNTDDEHTAKALFLSYEGIQLT